MVSLLLKFAFLFKSVNPSCSSKTHQTSNLPFIESSPPSKISKPVSRKSRTVPWYFHLRCHSSPCGHTTSVWSHFWTFSVFLLTLRSTQTSGLRTLRSITSTPINARLKRMLMTQTCLNSKIPIIKVSTPTISTHPTMRTKNATIPHSQARTPRTTERSTREDHTRTTQSRRSWLPLRCCSRTIVLWSRWVENWRFHAKTSSDGRSMECSEKKAEAGRGSVLKLRNRCLITWRRPLSREVSWSTKRCKTLRDNLVMTQRSRRVEGGLLSLWIGSIWGTIINSFEFKARNFVTLPWLIFDLLNWLNFYWFIF